ncbi:hypothetical protein BKA66DRAFT_232623 [Pyrenochaeta sp. MPI-SDFR-AT-0127]|nr:hypothetical protein BKA66DRAFT_232623 [Pyrenochaeta sp. MPI-SDFR-AT-0127]
MFHRARRVASGAGSLVEERRNWISQVRHDWCQACGYMTKLDGSGFHSRSASRATTRDTSTGVSSLAQCASRHFWPQSERSTAPMQTPIKICTLTVSACDVPSSYHGADRFSDIVLLSCVTAQSALAMTRCHGVRNLTTCIIIGDRRHGNTGQRRTSVQLICRLPQPWNSARHLSPSRGVTGPKYTAPWPNCPYTRAPHV